MRCSGQSSRGQFQIGNTGVGPAGVGRAGIDPRRKRSTGLPTACACPPGLWRACSLAQALCLLGIGWAKHTDRIVCATNSSLRSRRLGGEVLPLSPLAVALSPFFASSDVTSHSTLATSHCTSTRYTLRIKIGVTPTKQTTEAISTRYKKLSPGGVASWLLFRLARRISNRNTSETGIAVTPTKQTMEAISNRNKKPSPGEGTTLSLGRGLSPPHCTNARRERWTELGSRWAGM